MSKTHRLRNFLHRNERVISLIGAALVFFTFVVKEPLAEGWRDDADAIARARDAYSIKSDTQDVLMNVRQLIEGLHLNPLENVIPKTNELAWPLKTIEALNNPHIQGFRATMDNIAALMDRLPADVPERKELNDIKTEAQQIGHEFGAVFGHRIDVGTEITEAQAHEYYLKLDPIIGRLIQLSFRAEDLLRRVMDRAEKRRTELERRSSFWRWASYFLYTIGWGLAFVGRIFGLPISEAA